MRTVGFVNDMSSYFPLSQRPKRDETDVTNNWARHRGTVLLDLAGLLDELSEPPIVEAPLDLAGLVTELEWVSTTSRLSRLLRRTPPATRSGALGERVRALSTADLSSGARRSVADLGDAVVAAYRVASATGHPIAIDTVASGAVALARGLSGPVGARAVTSERTLVATDADWRVGRGPELPGTAEAIVLFLYGHGRPIR
jgi:hypothetical protein